VPGATMIALTAYVDAEGATALRDAGADEIVLKPLTLARLESVLRARVTSMPASPL
jgi:AmiR/NasT family two-component response regulator